MKKELNKNQVGLLVGCFMALFHALWSLLVATGLAQAFLDWIYGLHFLSNPFVVEPFNLVTAVTLVVVVFIFGYLFGWLFAFLWNKLRK